MNSPNGGNIVAGDNGPTSKYFMEKAHYAQFTSLDASYSKCNLV